MTTFTFHEFEKAIAEIIENRHSENKMCLTVEENSAMNIYAGIEDLQVGLKVEKQRAEKYKALLLDAVIIGLLNDRDNDDLWEILRQAKN